MNNRIKILLQTTTIVVAMTLASCTNNTTSSAIFDPYEETNRKLHSFNKSLDKSLLRPASNTYVALIPSPIVTGISNFSSNLELPVAILNGILQLDTEGVSKNTGRFLINSSVGLLGLFDVAANIGMYGKNTNFDQTLYTYGIREGAYTELPAFGPNTERSTAGLIINLAINPYGGVFKGAQEIIPIGAKVLDLMGKRHKYSDAIDGVLYQSDDSYAQSRQIYLERMRFAHEKKLDDAVYENPYASD
jgi:phospholipid-binding lipoprotein MlaA